MSTRQHVKPIVALGLILCVCSYVIANNETGKSSAHNQSDTSLYSFSKTPPASDNVDDFAKWRQETRAERCEWWKNYRFGMFIHWGIYSVPAGTYKGKRTKGLGEWIMQDKKIPVDVYRAYAKEFNPVKYDPDAWVKLAKEAGMKYIVITAKHHDGFALFDSKVTDWDVVDATPYGKDLLKPLAEACKKNGIKFCLYYSQAQDWTHPGGATWKKGTWDKKQKGSMDEYIDKIAVPQVKELLSNYGDLGIFWWDTPKQMNSERAGKLYSLLKLQPHIISNNRLGGGFGGDYGTPEQKIPKNGDGKNWETCMTMNKTWGYKSFDRKWKSTKTLIRQLADIVSKGGNYLLNIGPKADGTIPEASVTRLKEIGKWMEVNGESIYGCGRTSVGSIHPWGRVTGKKGRLYLHVFNKPKGSLTIKGVTGKPGKAWLLANPDAKPLKVTSSGDSVQIDLPAELPDPIDTVIALEVSGDQHDDR